MARKSYDDSVDDTAEIQPEPETTTILAYALEDLPAGAPIIVKPDGKARLAEADETWRCNAVAPYDVPFYREFEVETHSLPVHWVGRGDEDQA